MTSKKFDADIPKYFLNQLLNYEARLSKINGGVKSTSWADIFTAQSPDSDELLVRNSFLNGLSQKPIESLNSTYTRPTSSYKPVKTKLKWSDNGSNRKDVLCSFSCRTDLLTLKEKDLMKPIVTHIKQKPTKSILKATGILDNLSGIFKRPNTGNVKNTDTSMGYNNPQKINMTSEKYESTTPPKYSSKISSDEPLKNSVNNNDNNNPASSYGGRSNNFTNNKNASTRSFTSDQKDKNNEFTKIIITPVQKIVTTNINNYYIHTPNEDGYTDKMKYYNSNDAGSGTNNSYIQDNSTNLSNNKVS